MPHVKITGILTARPDAADRLRSLLQGMAPPSRAEAGNLAWNLWRDQSDPDRFVLDELYVDDDAVAAHHNSAHYRSYASQVPELAERLAISSTPVLIE